MISNICDRKNNGNNKIEDITNNYISDNTIENTTPKIINISTYNLTKSEKSLLKKGLKFCPTPVKSDLLNLEVDIKEFLRKLELLNFMDSKSYEDDSLLRKKGSFIPPKSTDPLFTSVLTQMKSVAENLENIPINFVHDNITLEERMAIKKLTNNDNIVIKKADKGGCIVIMDKKYYIEKVNECLSNSDVYKKLTKNVDNKIMHSIKNLTNKYKSCFDIKGKEIKYITDFKYKTANFYGLPKIHKSKTLIELLQNSSESYIDIHKELDLSFRFITGGPSSPTSKLSELLDILLKPYYCKIQSYIRDSTDFLNKLPNFKSGEVSDILLITCDVTNMYSNITLDLGLRAVTYWLYKYPEILHKRFNVDFILEALELVLRNSNFKFNNEFYTLIKGTVTGTTVAPTYANLTMAFLEVTLYEKVKEKFGEKVYEYVLKHWLRYLDDGILIWRKSFGDFNDFIYILNSLDSNINFTFQWSEQGLSYLNIYLYLDNLKLLTDVYYKATDSHDYLPFNSCHPRHIKQSIPENLARIVCTIVDDSVRKKIRLEELKKWLTASGYPHKLVDNAMKKILNIDQAHLRQIVQRKEDKLIVFVQYHNPKNPSIFSRLMECFNFLVATNKYKEIFKSFKVIKSERQFKNLGQLLQKSEVNSIKFDNGCKKCNKKSCGTCPYLLETDNVDFQKINYNFKLYGTFSCDSGNIIYKITCNGCREYYIGLTVNLRNRVSNHKFCLFNLASRIQKVHKHIFECAGNLDIPFSIIPFFTCKGDSFITRLATESYFIRKYKPLLNSDGTL